MFVNAMSSVLNPAQLVKLRFPPSQVFDAFIRILFGGVLTEKARLQFFTREGRA